MKGAKADTKSLLSSIAFCKLAYKSFLTQRLVPLSLVKVRKNGWQTATLMTLTRLILCTNESKLRVFQFKLLHRKVATNYFLLKIGIKSNDQYSFCKETSEIILHLFWECPFVKSFWNEITN